MRWIQGIRDRWSDDSGTALTEFAIIAPLFVILIYWSQSFADLGILKLKAEEAARYAVWEMTAQRGTGAVGNEVRTRFADLASPVEYSGSEPEGALTWDTVNVSLVAINDRVAAPFSGSIQQPSGGGGGIIGDAIEFVGKFLNKAADWVVERMDFETNGKAVASVQMTVENTLFPSGSVLGIFFDTGLNPTLTVRARSPELLWDTWKAWPGKTFGGTIETDPYETYAQVSSRASAPEKVVSKQVGEMKFFGIGNILGFADGVFNFIKMPPPFGSETWKEEESGDGPIAMLPGEPQRKSWQPGYQTPLQRIGDEWERSSTAVKLAPSGSANPGVDRQRFTTPNRVRAVYWDDPETHGENVRASSARIVPDNNNPYVDMYRCRDAYYMGSTREQLQHYNQSDWARRAHTGCN